MSLQKTKTVEAHLMPRNFFKSVQIKQLKGLSQQQTMQVKTAVPVGQPKNGSQVKSPITVGDESDIDIEVPEVPELSAKQL